MDTIASSSLFKTFFTFPLCRLPFVAAASSAFLSCMPLSMSDAKMSVKIELSLVGGNSVHQCRKQHLLWNSHTWENSCTSHSEGLWSGTVWLGPILVDVPFPSWQVLEGSIATTLSSSCTGRTAVGVSPGARGGRQESLRSLAHQEDWSFTGPAGLALLLSGGRQNTSPVFKQLFVVLEKLSCCFLAVHSQ